MKQIIFKVLITSILLSNILLIRANAATFNDINQSSVFLKQNTNYTCTLSASAMMVRRAAMASGNSNWSSITESSMRGSAWLEGTGLYIRFTYAGIKVNRAGLPTGSANVNQLISVLNSHPEGVVIYDWNIPHAILLTDYTNGTFYCADPSNAVARGRIPVSQASIRVENADCYWYVESPKISLTPSDPTPSISGANSPGTITTGSEYSISGNVSAGATITNVTVGCYDSNGSMKTGKAVNPNATSYNIANLNSYIEFNKLSPGIYTYRVSATTSAGTKTLVNKIFPVFANGETIKSGTYYIRVNSNANYGLAVEGGSSSPSANIVLDEAASKMGQAFFVWYESGGYYSIRNCKTGLYLDVQGGGSASGTNVIQYTNNGSNAQRWQILPTPGGYCLVPKCAQTTCLDVYDGNISANGDLWVYTANLTKAQMFKFVNTKLNVVRGNKITFKTNGGTLKGSFTSHALNGYNTGRNVDYLVVYNVPGLTVPTNEWGIEAAIDKNGKVTQIRGYQSTTKISVPDGGMVVSGHGSAMSFTGKLEVGQYVRCDYSNNKVYAYKTQKQYVAKDKYVKIGDKYGTLPTPTRDGYKFKGWYTKSSGGSKITEDSKYSTSTLYAHWSKISTKKVQKIKASDFKKTIGSSSFKINAKRTTGNGKLSYKSGNKKVATVNSKGKITIKGVGKATITITAAETKKYQKTTKKITVTVKPRGTSLSSVKSKSAETMTVKWKKKSSISGYQIQYSRKSDFSNDKKIRISSGYTGKKVSGLTGGKKYYVRVRTYKKVSGTRYYSNWSSKKYVTVKKAAKKGSVKLSGGSTGGSSCTFTAKTYPSNATVKWSSSNKDVATVSGGKVTAKGAGTATIKAKITYKDKTYTASKKITVLENKTYGSWSGWTTNVINASAGVEVRTTPLYRYYFYYCPVCGGREPFTGTSDCHKYTLSGSNWNEGWFPTPYSQCSPQGYSYTTIKKYTTSLGDGKRWNFSVGNLNDTAIGTIDSGSSSVVIKQGYSSRSVSRSYEISAID